jgi:hypothetical protein
MVPSNKEAFARLMILKGLIIHVTNTPESAFSEQYIKWSKQEQNDFDQKSRQQSEALMNNLKELGAWRYASPQEIMLFQAYSINMDKQKRIDAIWRKECAIILIWALGLRDTWPNIDQETTPEILGIIPEQKIGLFSPLPKLRPQKEILGKRSILETWHWRVRTRQLIEEGTPFPSDEKTSKAGFFSYDDVVRFTAKAFYNEGGLTEIIDDDFVFGGKSFRSLDTNQYQLARSIISEKHFALNWLCGKAPGNRWDETPTDT